MAVAARLDRFLGHHQINYHLLKHRPASTLLDTARSATLAPACVAQSHLLTDGRGRYWITLMGSDRHPDLDAIARLLGAPVQLCAAAGNQSRFEDCDVGIVPPFGQPYGLDTLVDSDLLRHPRVYVAAGDATELIRIEGDTLAALARDCRVAAIGIQGQQH